MRAPLTPGGPLARAALRHGLRQGPWTVLVLLALAVLAGAAASVPLVHGAVRDAELAERRADPPAALLEDPALVRVTTSGSPTGSGGLAAVREDLARVPSLTPPSLVGASAGLELVRPARWTSTATGPGGTAPARLLAVEDPAGTLRTTSGGGEGVWLPDPLARRLGLGAGDDLVLEVATGGATGGARTAVAGTYAVAPDGRRPADPPGRTTWARQRGALPADPDDDSRQAHLLVGDPATVERLAERAGDIVVWSLDAQLVPGATYEEAAAAADGVRSLRGAYVRGSRADDEGPVDRRVSDGVEDLVAATDVVADAVERRLLPGEAAAVGLALACVLGAGLLAVRRRAVELRHAAGAGLRPGAVGLLWALELLPAALLGVAAGTAGAWLLVVLAGPADAAPVAALPVAALLAAGACATGVLGVAATAALATARRVRPAPPAAPARRVPWGAVLVAAALAGAAGLASAPAGDGGARGADLLVPLLATAAAGALGAAVLARLVAPRGAARGAAAGTAPLRRPAAWLARRRLARGGTEQRVVVTVVAAGLGMLLFALSAASSTATAVQDRVAVRAGAQAVAVLDGSWQLDPGAPVRPGEPAAGEPPAGVPAGRTPPVPPGTSVVWRGDATTPLDEVPRELLLVDPAGLRDVVLPGRGPDLARARQALDELTAAAATGPGGDVPALVVGDPAAAGEDLLDVDALAWQGRLRVLDRLDAFPGASGPTYVLPADAVLGELGPLDPRLRPASGPGWPFFEDVALWASSARLLADTLDAAGARPESVSTAAEVRRLPALVAAERARGHQLAVAAYLGLLAALALAVHAERAASAGRAADLVLGRVGLRRRQVLGARVLELAALAAAGGACGVLAVLAVVPLGGRLLDDAPYLQPAVELAVGPAAVLLTAAAAAGAVLAGALAAAARAGTGGEEGAYRDGT
ncbi:hypothetical protein [Vallicoccus soli]|uniref:FtsX-like permease family protein n=1 Tax=Vallicoccus soli TaxID=2339232 RepID=A0A3A3YYQ3_9ACTN|nr:hypothetical protein [Vallicoccus soli]RJK95962.1 hypothetical protein D5H78_10250 [Vallicoccus soli]